MNIEAWIREAISLSLLIGASWRIFVWTVKRLDTKFDKIDERFDKIDERFEKVDERFEKVDNEFKEIRVEFKEVRKELTDFKDEVRVEFKEVRKELSDSKEELRKELSKIDVRISRIEGTPYIDELVIEPNKRSEGAKKMWIKRKKLKIEHQEKDDNE